MTKWETANWLTLRLGNVRCHNPTSVYVVTVSEWRMPTASWTVTRLTVYRYVRVILRRQRDYHKTRRLSLISRVHWLRNPCFGVCDVATFDSPMLSFCRDVNSSRSCVGDLCIDRRRWRCKCHVVKRAPVARRRWLDGELTVTTTMTNHRQSSQGVVDDTTWDVVIEERRHQMIARNVESWVLDQWVTTLIFLFHRRRVNSRSVSTVREGHSMGYKLGPGAESR